MAPTSTTIQFIDAALSCTTIPHALSYQDQHQKWIIKTHLLWLLENYPSFAPSTNTFTYNNGISVDLLYAKGFLHVADHAPLVPIIIWLNENYPYVPPMVFVSSPNASPHPLQRHHPFVDFFSGSTTCPYMQTWAYPKCDLTCLVHNLVKIFSVDHPFMMTSTQSTTLNSRPSSFSTHTSYVSKMEALDQICGTIHYDLIALQAKNEPEMEELHNLQAELVRRSDIATSVIIQLDNEKKALKHQVSMLSDQTDVLTNWVRVNGDDSKQLLANDGSSELQAEDTFECEDGNEESKLAIECLASDKAIEDVLYVLDRALSDKVVTFNAYIRQVRILARQQFTRRALLLKLKGPVFFSSLISL